MRQVVTTLAVVAAGYLLVLGFVFWKQRSLMYFPDQAMPSAAAVGTPWFREVRYAAADGLALAGWYVPAEPARPTVVLFHGNGGNLAYRAAGFAPFVARGVGVLLAGYRGYGGNAGAPSEAGFRADAEGALAFLTGEGVPPAQTVLIGESLGSGVAVQVAAGRAAALLLEAPFTSAADVGQRTFPFLPVRWLIRDRYDSASRIAGIGMPLLVVHGELDGIVPIRFGRRLFALAAEPKRAVWLPGADHNDLALHGLREIELDFLGEFWPALR